MKTHLLFSLVLFSLLLFCGCISTGEEGNGPMITPYYYDEEFSPFTGELERYAAPQPDDSGYAAYFYTVKGLSCPNGATPEIVSFAWDNPSTVQTYIAGSSSGPVAHYKAVSDAIFNVSVRVDYVCEGRPETAKLSAQRKKLMLYSAKEGILYVQEMRATCPGEYMLSSVSNISPIEKGISVGVDSGEGWIVSAYRLEVAEPYDYSTKGCTKYDEHWIHTYIRESANGTSCALGECRGTWYTYECPADNSKGIRMEAYAGRECASVSAQKDFRHPQKWYQLLEQPDFPTPLKNH